MENAALSTTADVPSSYIPSITLTTAETKNKLPATTATRITSEISNSNQRRYSKVVEEYVRKRDSLGPDPKCINPSTILTIQADQASPEGLSYVSFISDDSFDKNVNFSPNPLSDGDGLFYHDCEMTFPATTDPPHPAIEGSYNSAKQGELVEIRTSKLSRNTEDRKAVTFIITPQSYNGGEGASLYSEPQYAEDFNREVEKSTSTPIDNIFPRHLNFNEISGGSRIPQGGASPSSGPVGEEVRTSSPVNSSSKKKRSLRSPKSPVRHRGSYTVPQSPACDENQDRKNTKGRLCSIILIFTGLLIYLISFIIWFVIAPYYDSLEG